MSQDNSIDHREVRPPAFRRNIDDLNDETFGETAPTNDWEAAHNAFVRGSPGSTSEGLNQSDAMNFSSTQEEVLPEQLSQMKIKDLWPTSPKQASIVESIWSSPELPPKQIAQMTPRTAIESPSPFISPGKKILTVEELENEYPSPPPPVSSEPHPLGSPVNHPLPPPPGFRMPRPPLLSHMMGQSPPLRLPPHFLLAQQRGMPPGFPPPHPHFLPPRILPPPQHNMHGFQRMPMQGPPRQSVIPPSHFHPSHLHVQPHRMPPAQGPFSPPNMPPPHLHIMQQQSDFIPRKSRRSEYLGEMKTDGSGFMTQREKEWVIRIQLLQLQATDPANEDFYYLNYFQRKQHRSSHPVSSNQPPSDGSSDEHPSSVQSDDQNGTQILALPHISREERPYKPAEFSGTLGKLSVSSVGAPRKSIDVPISANEGGKDNPGGSSAKKKQALIVIEKLYVHVLTLEDLEKKALALPEEDRAQMLTRRDELRSTMFSLLQLKYSDVPWNRSDVALFHQIMIIRKGKRLLKRILPLFSDAQSQSVLLALLQNLPTIIKRDSSDQVLSELTLSVTAVISMIDLHVLNKCLGTLLEGTSSTSSSVSASLVRIGQNEFGATLLNELLTRGLSHIATDDRPNQMERDLETWHKLSSQVYKDVLSHKEQFNTAKPATATLLHTLTSISNT